MQIKGRCLQWGCFTQGPKSPPKEYSTRTLALWGQSTIYYRDVVTNHWRSGSWIRSLPYLAQQPPLTPCLVQAQDGPGGLEAFYYLLLNAHCHAWPFLSLVFVTERLGGGRGLGHSHAFQLLSHQKGAMHHQAAWSPSLVHSLQPGPEIRFQGVTIQTSLFTEAVSSSEINTINYTV